jgi:NADH-quinone oxidoreductase subunit E
MCIDKSEILKTVKNITQKYKGIEGSLIHILQDIQSHYKFLPKDALLQVSGILHIPYSQIYAVATFYKIFSLKPKGKYLLRVCMGTACHVKGAPLLLESIERELKIKSGDTTPDSKFTLETVNCVGACSLAPIIRIDEDTHGRLKQASVPKILEEYSK